MQVRKCTEEKCLQNSYAQCKIIDVSLLFEFADLCFEIISLSFMIEEFSNNNSLGVQIDTSFTKELVPSVQILIYQIVPRRKYNVSLQIK